MSDLSWAVEAAQFEVSLTRIGGLAYARLSGEADLCGWQALNEMADALTTDPISANEVVIDLTHLRFACVRTIRILAGVCSRLRAQGIPTQVRGMQPVVARVAKLVEVDLPTGGTPTSDRTGVDLIERPSRISARPPARPAV